MHKKEGEAAVEEDGEQLQRDDGGVRHAPASIGFSVLLPQFSHESLGRVDGPREGVEHERRLQSQVYDGIVEQPQDDEFIAAVQLFLASP